MYHTTGLDKAEILDLCEMIHREAVADERAWPPILGLYKSVVVTLTYLRRNRPQEAIVANVLGEDGAQHCVIQPIETLGDVSLDEPCCPTPRFGYFRQSSVTAPAR